MWWPDYCPHTAPSWCYPGGGRSHSEAPGERQAVARGHTFAHQGELRGVFNDFQVPACCSERGFLIVPKEHFLSARSSWNGPHRRLRCRCTGPSSPPVISENLGCWAVAPGPGAAVSPSRPPCPWHGPHEISPASSLPSHAWRPHLGAHERRFAPGRKMGPHCLPQHQE